ncbi:uncharacterized protein LOC116611877 [Nematostella vectensis]|uniref:uncharacterized protein LOC116611877 n=1 Tax=Nematostella vectensis TaxID=45351 RepID=UPI00207799B7|nr:uncharacterized protein LOC116611877 [Nematostella vectensis]
MENGYLIHMHDPVVQFCVSYITINVAEVGLQQVVSSWNQHPIEERNSKILAVVAQRTNQVKILHPSIIPSVEEAIRMYRQAGGSITEDCSFGVDPLLNHNVHLQRRNARFFQNNPSFHCIFQNIVNGDGSLMESAILSYLDLTKTLSP